MQNTAELNMICQKINKHFKYHQTYIQQFFEDMLLNHDLKDLQNFWKSNYQWINLHDGELFALACITGKLDVAKWVYSLDDNINIHWQDDYAFTKCCVDNHFDVAFWLYSLSLLDGVGHIYIHNGIGNSRNADDAFYYSCLNGNLKMAKLLYKLSQTKEYGQLSVNYHFICYMCCKYGKTNSVKWLCNTSKKDRNIRLNISTKYQESDSSDAIYDNHPIFQTACEYGHLKIVIWLLKNYDINIRTDNDEAFYLCCISGKNNLVKWLYNYSITKECPINILNRIYEIFLVCCKKGQLQLAQFLYKLTNSQNHSININYENDKLFSQVALTGQLDVAKWLLSVNKNINIHTNDDLPFRNAGKNLHFDFVIWLFSLDNKINIHGNKDEIFTELCDVGKNCHSNNSVYSVDRKNYNKMVDLILSLTGEQLPRQFRHPNDIYECSTLL